MPDIIFVPSFFIQRLFVLNAERGLFNLYPAPFYG